VSDTKIHKVFWFDYDFRKQEIWLNEMAAKGTNPVPSIDWLGMAAYRFEQGAPGEWIYRIELLSRDAKKPESREYLAFMTDAGVETMLARDRFAIFRKRAADGPFELFSDLESRIPYVRRLRRWTWWWMAFAAYMFVTETVYLIPPTDPIMTPFVQVTFLLWLPVLGTLIYQAVVLTRRIRSLEAQRQVTE
jgi:hypothetical protein